MSIKPLPGDVVAQIKSSIVITSLGSVIYGLLCNSLDAGATKINIAVDFRRGNCSVEDDGQGIPPSEFYPGGGLGKLHYTSKYPREPSCHGRHGSFLSSVGALSLLSIASHHCSHNSHNSISIHNSKVISRNTPAPLEHKIVAFTHGTRVTIRDLFGNMPVRVKQRALEAEKSPSSKEWDSLVRDIVSLLLAWPGNVMVVLRDSSSSQVLTLKSTEPASDIEQQPRRRLAFRTMRLLSQSSLCTVVDRESWVPIKASAPGFSVQGAVCLVPAPTKRVQFMSIGIEPILDKYHSNVLYNEVNQVFSNSAFGVVEEYDGPAAAHGFRGPDGLIIQKAFKSRKGVDRWPIFYVSIHLENPSRQEGIVDEMLDEGRASLSILIDMLRAMFYEFLKKHHFHPRNTHLSSEAAEPKQTKQADPSSTVKDDPRPLNPSSAQGSRSALKKRRLGISRDQAPGSSQVRRVAESRSASGSRSRSGSPFASWAITKTGGAEGAFSKPEAESTETHISNQPKRPTSTDEKWSAPEQTPREARWRPLVGDSGQLLRRPFDDFVVAIHGTRREAEDIQTGQTKTVLSSERDTITWQDPILKLRSIIDSRNDFAAGPDSADAQSNPMRNFAPRSDPDGNSTAPKGVPGPWLSDFLSSWQNPVFETVEKGISRLPATRDDSGARLRAGRPPSNCQSAKHSSELDKWARSLQGRITKRALCNAKLISQVDQKFLLIKIPMDSLTGVEHGQDEPELLVLVDQHAADERCRVEALMQGYFAGSTKSDGSQIWTASTESLGKPLRFDVPSQEHKLLEQSRKHFEHWGVFYRLLPAGNMLKSTEASVQVLSLPPSISERCELEPRLVIDLLRKEIWKLHESGHLAHTHSIAGASLDTDVTDHSWIGRFHNCPRGILDLINSRACRSAIMFNDELSREECNALLERLATCAFPFQCAHGRPSMVPLVDIGSNITTHSSTSEGVQDLSYSEAFKRWQTTKVTESTA